MDMRTPLGKVRGLGSAKSGVHHFWMQRLTAVALIPLVIWFAVSLVMLSGADYGMARSWLSSPFVMVLLILTICIGLYHGQLGMQVVIEDYVGDKGTRTVAIVAAVVLVSLVPVVGGLLGNQIGGGSGKKVATAAGVVGGAVLGNKIEKDRNSTTQYDVVVQYDAGGSDVFSFSSAPNWQSGDRVKVVNGQITSSL